MNDVSEKYSNGTKVRPRWNTFNTFLPSALFIKALSYIVGKDNAFIENYVSDVLNSRLPYVLHHIFQKESVFF